jgi:hypothetical protein
MKKLIAVVLFFALVLPVSASVIEFYFLYDAPAETDTAGNYFVSSEDNYFVSSEDNYFVSN